MKGGPHLSPSADLQPSAKSKQAHANEAPSSHTQASSRIHRPGLGEDPPPRAVQSLGLRETFLRLLSSGALFPGREEKGAMYEVTWGTD